MSAVETEDHVPEQLVEQVSRGYDALAIEVARYQARQRDLENKLSWAKQQVKTQSRFVQHIYVPLLL